MLRYSVLVVTLFILAAIITTYVEPPFAKLVRPSGAITRFLFSVVMIAALVGKLVLKNRRYNTVISGQNEHLNRYNKQLKSFNYIVSHDLKEPLRNIVGFSQLIKKQTDQGIAINEVYLNHLIQSTRQLDKLVADLNDFTTSEEQELTKQVVCIEEIISDIKLSMSQDIAERDVEITCQSFPPILSSKLALTIVLRNLIENGIKYNDKTRPQIRIEGKLTNDTAQIRVIDNGIGIEERYFEEVFEMFKRLNSDYKKGSGLGLNISQNLIKRLGGDIFIVASTLEEGTTFQINFPAKIMDFDTLPAKSRMLKAIS